jgi:hypothetical protein
VDSFTKQFQTYARSLLKTDAKDNSANIEDVNSVLNLLRDKIERYRRTAASIINRSLNEVPLNICSVNCTLFKQLLADEAIQIANSLLSNILSEIRTDAENMLETIDTTIDKVNKRCSTPEDFYDFSKYFEGTQKLMGQLEDRFKLIEKKWKTIEYFSYPVTDYDISLYWGVFSRPQDLAITVHAREVRLLQERNSFIRQLEEQKDQFTKDLQQYDLETANFKNYFDVEKAEEVKFCILYSFNEF